MNRVIGKRPLNWYGEPVTLVALEVENELVFNLLCRGISTEVTKTSPLFEEVRLLYLGRKTRE